MLRAVGGAAEPAVPAYTELTCAPAGGRRRGLELWVAGQDLLHDRHPEFGADLPTRVEFERVGPRRDHVQD